MFNNGLAGLVESLEVIRRSGQVMPLMKRPAPSFVIGWITVIVLADQVGTNGLRSRLVRRGLGCIISLWKAAAVRNSSRVSEAASFFV